MKKQQWFECKVQEQDQSVADIHIFGMIGSFIDDMFGKWDGMTTAKSFVDAVAALPETVKTLKIRINSPGGDVFGGITIANALRSEQTRGRKVETIVEGLAASAASIIAMGGSPVKISDNGIMMVHSPWTGSMGNARDLRATADILDTIQDTLVKTYQWHSPLDAEKITALIHGEDGQGTWLDAAAAVENGFATEIVEGLQAVASIDARAVASLNIPEKFADRVKAFMKPMATMMMDENLPKVGDRVKLVVPPHMEGHDEGIVRQALDGALGIEFDAAPGEVHHWYVPSEVMVIQSSETMDGDKKKQKKPMRMAATPPDPAPAIKPAPGDHVLKACADAGLDLAFASTVLSEGLTADALSARITAEKATRVAAETRANNIRALCGKAHEDLAPELIASSLNFDQVKAHMAKVSAKLDKVEIDAGLAPEQGKGKKPAINISAIYAELNKAQH